MRMTYRAVFFDLDGTLVETAPEIADAVNDTLAYFDWPAVSQTLVNGWIGHGTQALLVEALAHVTQQSVPKVRQSAHLKDALPVFDRYYQNRCGTRSQLYPHVRDALAHLRAQGIKLALVTNKEGRYTQTVLQVHQLTAMFDAVVSGDTLRVKKPNPSAVELHLKKWGVNQENALFVGDSSIDAATARNAGIAVWLLPYGYNMGEPVAACQPDRVISDVSELMNL